MDNNIVRDINDLYLNQVVNQELDESKKSNDGNLANNYPPYDEVTYGDVVAGRLGKDQMGGKKKRKKVDESKKSNDGNLANNYPPYDEVTYGDVVAGRLGKDQMGGKKKKVTKEGFSNWRHDLSEVISDVESNTQVKQRKIQNKIKTSAIGPGIQIPEVVKNLGGTLIEMIEIEDFEDIFNDLSESDIFFLTDQLIEEVVEEVFFESIQEGYDALDIENVLLESLEISSQILSEAKVTLGHDTKIKSDRLEKVKSAVKNVGKKLVHGAGYVAGAAVRGAKAVGRELGAGYQRGRHGAGGSSSSSSSRPTATQGSSESQATGSSRPTVTQGSSESQATGSSRPGLLGRIASKLGRGLRKIIHKGARAVQRGAGSVARRTADRPKVTQGRGDDHSKDQRERDLLNRAMYDRVRSHEDHGTPSSVHGKIGVRKPSVRSGIGGGKRIEVAGSGKTDKKEPEIKKVTPKKTKAPEGTTENPRVSQPGPEKSKPESKPTVKTTTIKTDTPSGSKPPRRARRRKGGPSVEEVKAKINKREEEQKRKAEQSREANQLLKDLTKEEYQLSEKAESKQQQKIFGLALSVKRGETPRSEVSAEVLKIVDSMSEKKIRDFAKTSHEGIPKKVQTKEEAIREALLAKMIEKIEEQSEALEMQPKTQPVEQEDPRAKQIEQRDIQTKKRLLQQKMAALQKGATDIDV